MSCRICSVVSMIRCDRIENGDCFFFCTVRPLVIPI
jgi:hypothetical protein